MEILEWSITSESKKLMYDFTKMLKIAGCIIRKLENVDEKKNIYIYIHYEVRENTWLGES